MEINGGGGGSYRHVSRGGGRKGKPVKTPFLGHLGKDAKVGGVGEAAKETNHGDAGLAGIVGRDL